MNREEIERKLYDILCDYCCTKSEEVLELFDNLEAQLKSKDELLMEFAEEIIDSNKVLDFYGYYCLSCEDKWSEHLNDNCIVKKAQDYIGKES